MNAELFEAPAPTLREQIAEVERELKQRERVYAHQVAAGKMTRKKADWHTTLMQAVLATLKALQARGGVA